VPDQLASPIGVAATRGAPCPRSRDGLPDRDGVPETVHRVPAKWVPPRWPRLHPPSVGTRLAIWSGTVGTHRRGNLREVH